jgi:hypothetical protein
MGQRGKHTIIKFDDSGGSPVTITAEVLEGSGIPLSYDELEESGYGEDKKYMKGQGDSAPTLKVKFNSTTHALFTHASTGALGSDTARTLEFQFGNNAAPTGGDPKITGEFIVTSAEMENEKSGLRALNIKFAHANASVPTYGTV